jgi:hypothetical protein
MRRESRASFSADIAVEKRCVARRCVAALLMIAALVSAPRYSLADEDGVSFWVPGTFGSLAAVPQAAPGWALGTIYYHTSVSAGGEVAAARQARIGRFSPTVNVNLNANLDAVADVFWFAPSYAFATPVFGGQLTVGMTGIFGRSRAAIDGTLTAALGPLVVTRSGIIDDSVTGFGDLYPVAKLRWNHGVHNYMVYATGDIPVGAYDPSRIANLGIGHGAIDGGFGYTYFDPTKGHELSAVAGFTYNFENPDTNYRNGVDFHLDWGASQFLSKQLQVGLVGYYYQQLTADNGQLAILGDFKSRVAGIGPQIGYLFPVGDMQGYLNLKGYKEFAAENRPEGWNVWLTFAISPPAPTAATPSPSRRPMITK